MAAMTSESGSASGAVLALHSLQEGQPAAGEWRQVEARVAVRRRAATALAPLPRWLDLPWTPFPWLAVAQRACVKQGIASR